MTITRDTLRKQHFDTNVRPQDDFFHYAGGGWIQKNPIPQEESQWGTFHVLIRDNHRQLRSLVRDLAARKAQKGTAEQLVGDFWRSGMDTKRRAKLGFAPLAPYMRAIDAINSVDDVVEVVAMLEKDGLGGIWASVIGIDDKNSERQELIFWQDGLSLPDRDFYLKDTPEYKSIRTKLLAHIARMLVMYGFEQKEARIAAKEILALETELARASRTPVALRDPHKQYNPHSLMRLKKRAPHINWKKYLMLLGTDTKKVIVGQPEFLARVDALLTTTALSTWKHYLSWHLIGGTSGYLSEAVARAQFDFYGTVLQGVPKMKPLWRRVINVIDMHIPDALGKAYVTRHFPPIAKRRADAMTKNIIAACKERIEQLPWMTTKTKRFALKKLSAIRPKIGHPKRFLSYSGVTIEGDDYFGNIIRTNRFYHKRDMRKIGKKPDPDEWLMTASTVNAYFHPNRNEIVFPAGILQPPFFDPLADDAVNYGAIGSIIGHEITHAFDDEGRKYDENGNLKEWWAKEDAAEFSKRADVLRKQYDAFEVLPKHRVNGTLTLGENIADLGGLIIAFEAWKKTAQAKEGRKIGGFTPEQRFFLAFAFGECGTIRNEALKKRLITDPHSPSVCRVNGPLPNIDAFYEAFDVKRGDKLFLPEAKRARIW